MIQEDYVSFETAKLLKEKGFEGFTMFSYSTKGTTMCGHWENETDWLPKCTLQMAMKWLMEMHKIYIDISPTYSEIEKTIHFIWQIFDSNYDFAGDCEIFYGNYETACEEAIKYCLEDLI